MPLTAIDNPTMQPTLEMAPASASAGRHGAPGFGESMLGALERGDDDADAEQMDEQQAREAAQQLVASAFLLPLMGEMRKGTFEADFLERGPGRDAFEQKLHTRLADDMVQRMDLPIVDAVTRFVTGQQPTVETAPGARVDRHG